MTEFFVSHTLPDTAYCRELILPSIRAVVERRWNQYVFMNRDNFGSGTKGDNSNPELFAQAYSKEIYRLLEGSRFMLLVASNAATRSKWIHDEVEWWMQNRTVGEMLMVIREPCEPTQIDPQLGQCHSVEMFDPSGVEEAAELKSLLSRLLDNEGKHQKALKR